VYSEVLYLERAMYEELVAESEKFAEVRDDPYSDGLMRVTEDRMSPLTISVISCGNLMLVAEDRISLHALFVRTSPGASALFFFERAFVSLFASIGGGQRGHQAGADGDAGDEESGAVSEAGAHGLRGAHQARAAEAKDRQGLEEDQDDRQGGWSEDDAPWQSLCERACE
jgi:hypothetical protein